MLDWVGWLATTIFVCSYFGRNAARMCRLQAIAAVVWIGYGLLIWSQPLMVANLIVAVMAGYASTRRVPDR